MSDSSFAIYGPIDCRNGAKRISALRDATEWVSRSLAMEVKYIARYISCEIARIGPFFSNHLQLNSGVH
ncbi:MAG: hypothetical protein LZF60_220006 [Nitrospira sp.]|nr:MAG: hypothetical protein LZF60_220006 [Nitrospira sp.]